LRPQPLLLRRSIAPTLVSFEAQPLLSHAFYFFVEGLHFLIVLLVLRFRLVALAQLLKRFLDREFGGLSH
jgi:hypothetical protein